MSTKIIKAKHILIVTCLDYILITCYLTIPCLKKEDLVNIYFERYPNNYCLKLLLTALEGVTKLQFLKMHNQI